MKVLDLFSGIGGFSLGLERAGMQTVAFCEIGEYGCGVLAKHWPNVPCHADITTREFTEGEADVICGGFPCQDISAAGGRAGITGERSGLWRELLRAIRVVRPIYAIVENVAALLGRGMGTVLGDLAEIGQDAEWHCIPARAVGAPHIRDRVWIVVADPARGGHGLDGLGEALKRQLDYPGEDLADAPSRDDGSRHAGEIERQESQSRNCGSSRHLAHADNIHVQGVVAGIADQEVGGGSVERSAGPCGDGIGWWSVEPDVGRVAYGVPSRVDRLKGLGNAVVPQIPEIIGRAIMNIALSLEDRK
jgi:DNA (cytosine-5)-methyltransferase 1